MPNALPRPASVASEVLVGKRHRSARTESFVPASEAIEASGEAARLRDFLVAPLRELAHSADARLRSLAEGALEAARLDSDPFAYLAQLEDALAQIAEGGVEGGRAVAEDALAIYRGR